MIAQLNTILNVICLFGVSLLTHIYCLESSRKLLTGIRYSFIDHSLCFTEIILNTLIAWLLYSRCTVFKIKWL